MCIRDRDIHDGLARIDLSKEVLKLQDAAAESNMVTAIAQTLTELQNGRFQLDIRGDLFTAHLYLPLAQDLQPNQTAEEPHPSL